MEVIKMTVGIDFTSAWTSVGTATAKTQLGGDLTLPAWARNIWGIMPQGILNVITAAETMILACLLESDDFSVAPFECLAAPEGATLGASGGGHYQGRQEKYAVGCPVAGGSRLRVYGQALVANTAAPVMGAGVVVSDQNPGHVQKHAKLGTATTTGTTATADVAGTAYRIVGGSKITELLGILGGTTVAGGDALGGYLKFSSSEFLQNTPLKLPLNVIPTGLATLQIAFIDGVSRAPVSVGVRSPTTIQDYLYMPLAPGAAGNFISGVVYE